MPNCGADSTLKQRKLKRKGLKVKAAELSPLSLQKIYPRMKKLLPIMQGI